MIEPSDRLKNFLEYPFNKLDKLKEKVKEEGFRIIDLSVGDPKEPLYEGSIVAGAEGIKKHASSGYPSYIGMKKLREAISSWFESRFNVKIDAEKNVTITAGAKEAIFHFPFAIINEGDFALIPSIGYPPYKAGVIFAGGKPIFYDLIESEDFLPDIAQIEDKLREAKGKIKMIWINFPNNPTTAIASKKFYEELIDLSHKYNFVIASDEVYSEIYKDEKPHSIIEFTDYWDNIMVFQSFSKRSNATGLRIGFTIGGEKITRYFRGVKMQVDSGVANFIQEAALAAISDEKHVENMRRLYNTKREILSSSLREKGIKIWSKATIYIWAKVKANSIEFFEKLLRIDEEKKIGICVTPGEILSLNNNEYASSFVRISLTALLEDIIEASEIIRNKL